MTDPEIRMICLNKVLKNFSGLEIDEIITHAEKIYDFITNKDEAHLGLGSK